MSPACQTQSPKRILVLKCLLLIVSYITACTCMSAASIAHYRSETRSIFYHGLTSYMTHAFPEDELRPLTCGPLTRDRANPAHIEVNDVLGNYSLSLVDSLSTLAILASTPKDEADNHDALYDFQRYVSLLVDEYGDGSEGLEGQGRRGRGFDLDSKVQLFETTIRGLGGLLSAHLFAVGDLPIRGYHPIEELGEDGRTGILWDRVTTSRGAKFVYDGQLLRLAYDLGTRLLPAFGTKTGIPYPRVNLRYGVSFYENAPQNNDAERGTCSATQAKAPEREVTETCSAGAGSLVLEFTVLSRLTRDRRFERLAKKAFWAVWEHRSGIGLLGAGIDAETGQWISPYTGIGAGIDSFFEYAFKSHVLLSGLETFDAEMDAGTSGQFLETWDQAHAAISRHIFRGPQHQHPHYAQNDMWTGGPRWSWIDSLSAYYPGLLALAGHVEEAAVTHLLYTALWERYGALPERWNTATGIIDAGLRWWGGRPEFVESTWYLYRATEDPWYLHVGEMVLKDIKQRCWTPCGWAGLQDVRTGEQTDRMESFFLGETAKYMYLLFDPDHPLNNLDSAFVFTTEGHPLIIPNRYKSRDHRWDADPVASDVQCPASKSSRLFGVSDVAGRPDVYHAAYLARLPHMFKDTMLDRMGTASDESAEFNRPPSSADHTIFPWTLPASLIPWNATCSLIASQQTFDLTFPALPNTTPDFTALQRIDKGILVKSLSGLRFAMVAEEGLIPGSKFYRIQGLSGLALGRDETLHLSDTALSIVNPSDPNFSVLKNTEIADLIIDSPEPYSGTDSTASASISFDLNSHVMGLLKNSDARQTSLLSSTSSSPSDLSAALLKLQLQDGTTFQEHLDAILTDTTTVSDLDVLLEQALASLSSPSSPLQRFSLPAMLPSGPGAAPLSSTLDALPDATAQPLGQQGYISIMAIDSQLCSASSADDVLSPAPQVLVLRRGGCSFSEKLVVITTLFVDEPELVIIVGAEDDVWSRPFLDQQQRDRKGNPRTDKGVPLVLIEGGREAWNVLARTARRIGHVNEQGMLVLRENSNANGGIGVKRRFWFASSGVRIVNLFMA